MFPESKPADVFGSAPLLNDGKGMSSSAAASLTPEPDHQTHNYRTATGKYRWYLLRIFWKPIKFILIFGIIGTLLAIPLIVIDVDSIENKAVTGDVDGFLSGRTLQLIYYIFGWFFFSWIGLAGCYAIGTVLPYVFRFVARYVNPAHARYWRIFRTVRTPLCIAGGVSMMYISFAAFIYLNRDNLGVTYTTSDNNLVWIDIIEDFLQQGTLWVWVYFVEKMFILYITIHYHSRSDLNRIQRSKNMQNALMALYDASVYLYPVGTPEFTEEDTMIGNATGSEHGEYRVRATRYLSRMGIDTYGLTSFFGNFMSSDPNSHWLRPASTYAIVERAVANPKSAAALGRRIWMSLVPMGKEVLTSQDIAEVLGPFRKEEAEEYFKALDEAEIGDIRLDEIEWTVAEAGRVRNRIYRSMHAADHCINSFDWTMLGALAAIFIYFILVFWVPALKDIQDTIKTFSFGLAFAVGRTLHHFLAGCIFILFDHPYDIGDRIELWSGQGGQPISLVVVRTSLLYTVFKRVDNWMELQAGNEYLQTCRIENVSRSGSNRQSVTLMIDVNTSFKDLQYTRTALETFVRAPENKRDYMPTIGLGITGVGPDLTKLELRCTFTHRSNFANEPLRAARSMKFMCALVATIRAVPLQRPQGGAPLGKAQNATHYVLMSSEEAKRREGEEKEKEKEKRWDVREKKRAEEGERVAAGGPVIDLSGITGASRKEGEEEVSDEELVRRAVEEAEKKRREEEEKEAEELAARQSLTKMPAVPRVGPPPRGEPGASALGAGLTTGFQVIGGAGMRSLPHFKR